MKATRFSKLLIWSVFYCLTTGLTSCVNHAETVKAVMDNAIDRLYKTKNAKELSELDYEKVFSLFSKQELHVLSTHYWMFDVNVPVVVSVMRSSKQKVVPFWLSINGFVRTGMILKNEQTTYEVWQKTFGAGTVGLGINGFENYPLHYFVSVAPKNKNEKPVASPADGTIYVISIAIPDDDGPIPEQYYAEVQLNGEMLYQTVDIKGDSLVYKAMNIDGVVRDQMVIIK